MNNQTHTFNKRTYYYMNIPITVSPQVFMYRNYGHFVMRGPVGTGSLNGYVVIKPGQKGYDFAKDSDFDFTDSTIDCHGGITDDFMVKDRRVIGFDTAHPGDFDPASYETAVDMVKTGNELPESLDRFKRMHVWTFSDIDKECKHIIDQLIDGDYKLVTL